MLELKGITKNYAIGDGSVTPALRSVDVRFRKSEFVSILGPSGCGKTTLLNIVGGLDQYTSGDLIINGVSTKQYGDSDWDSYRNHSIGFVFQSYNLIPHQTVLANVELALTLSGVSKTERRERAIRALEQVGLGDQIKKKPGQMSGGQMQRVAIARALVNDPDILLADEPTGALDTVTSVQIMEILKEISKDKLIIMVTHNPELAETYSSRIIRLSDGVITADSNPFTEEEYKKAFMQENGEAAETKRVHEKKRRKKAKRQTEKTSMSFLTALSLSLNNLMTKKARTALTSFAGSIGIIGIALILSLSNGIQLYINQVQEDTLSTYPLTISAEEQDYSALLSAMTNVSEDANREVVEGTIYVDDSMGSMLAAMSSKVSNNLEKFMAHLEANRTDLSEYLLDIGYSYNFDMQIYSGDGETRINPTTLFDHLGSDFAGISSMLNMSGMKSSFNVFSEMINNRELIETQYDLIGGTWAEDYNEVMLVVNKNNTVTNLVLYILGIEDQEEAAEVIKQIMENGSYEINDKTFSYEDFLGMEFYIVPGSSFYEPTDRTFTVNGQEYSIYADLREDKGFDEASFAVEHGVKIKISGILRPSDRAVASSISGAIAYNHSLTEYIVDLVNASEIVDLQKSLPTHDFLTGLEFDNDQYKNLSVSDKAAAFDAYLREELLPTKEDEIDDLKEKIILALLTAMSEEEENAFISDKVAQMSLADKAAYVASRYSTTLYDTHPELYKGVTLMILRTQLGAQYDSMASMLEGMSPEQLKQMMDQNAGSAGGGMSAEEMQQMLVAILASFEEGTLNEYVATIYRDEMQGSLVEELKKEYTKEQLIALFDARYAKMSEEEKATLYDRYLPDRVSKNTYKDVLYLLGSVSKTVPSAINLYAKDFASKDSIVAFIDAYNDSVDEADQIKYTDYVGLMMSSVTTIINVISYVLIAFVSISLVVSSIMIGIITYISVLERTKEIGILRAIGASKKNISSVFNAETLIVGFASGVIGIVTTILLCIPINWIIRWASGIPNIGAELPWVGAVVLILISMGLTAIAGLIPSRLAAKKDPVVALRSE